VAKAKQDVAPGSTAARLRTFLYDEGTWRGQRARLEHGLARRVRCEAASRAVTTEIPHKREGLDRTVAAADDWEHS
jgi:hypothetical protein